MARVLRGESAAFAELLVAMRPRVRFVLSDRYEWLAHAHRDLADQAESLFFEWWQAGELNPKDTVDVLILRLISQVVRSETRHQERKVRLAEALETEARAEGHEPLAAVSYSPEQAELMDQIEGLPEKHREVLWAEVAASQGEAPPPHERLGLTPEAYRQRLHRARAALLMKRRGVEKEIDDV
jgi:DNA-directed RNA polymerase specialized sigma24 family protein